MQVQQAPRGIVARPLLVGVKVRAGGRRAGFAAEALGMRLPRWFNRGGREERGAFGRCRTRRNALAAMGLAAEAQRRWECRRCGKERRKAAEACSHNVHIVHLSAGKRNALAAMVQCGGRGKDGVSVASSRWFDTTISARSAPDLRRNVFSDPGGVAACVPILLGRHKGRHLSAGESGHREFPLHAAGYFRRGLFGCCRLFFVSCWSHNEDP